MADKAKKTEHQGAKKGAGAYRGAKKEAKRESNKKRHVLDKKTANPKYAVNWRDFALENSETKTSRVLRHRFYV